MLSVLFIVCFVGVIGLIVCCAGFTAELRAYRRCSSVQFLGTNEPEQRKLRLVKRIQSKRQIALNSSTTMALRHGMNTPRLRAGSR